jgi:methyl-accepting chemotaxis protein
MLKNMKIGTKLLVICAALVVIPLVVVAYISVTQAGQGLEGVENEQLASRSKEIANTIDKVFEEEMKLTKALSIHPVVVAATNARAVGTAEDLEQRVAELDAVLSEFTATAGLGDDSQVVYCADLDGMAFAASHAEYLDISFADRVYIREALAGRINTGAVAQNRVTGQPFVPVAAPIYSESGKVIGAIANILDISFVNELVTNSKIGQSGYAYVVDNTGLIIAHPVADNVFQTNLAELDGTREFTQKMVAGQSGVDKYVFQGIAKTCGYAPVVTTGWSVGLTLPDEEYLAPVTAVRNIAVVVTAVALALAFIILIFFVRSIVRPLGQAVEYAGTVAEGDFTHRLNIQRKDEVGKLTDALNQMVERLKEMVLEIRVSAEQVASSSEEISASAQQLSSGAQNQASTLEETSASVEEMTASVEQVADHAQSQAASVEESSSNMQQMETSVEQVSKTLTEVSDSAKTSMEKAQAGADAVARTVEATKAITMSFEQISGIVNVISDIADQTNLLALNASIEAARAGEHGRGFAVVADEVSKLADRSASSTKEIENLIKEGSASVTAGTEVSQEVLVAMEEIISGAKKTNEMVTALAGGLEQQIGAIKELAKATGSISEMSQSISAATEEQTTNAKQVAKAIENVNELTQQAASAAEEMSAATEELSSLAQALQRVVEQFRINEEEQRSGRALPQPKPQPARDSKKDYVAGSQVKASSATAPPRISAASQEEVTAVALKKRINGDAA